MKNGANSMLIIRKNWSVSSSITLEYLYYFIIFSYDLQYQIKDDSKGIGNADTNS